jgi:hypothetical protein
MKYLGWIISLILIITAIVFYKTHYLPLREDINRLEKEIAMWENVLKGEKGLSGDRNRFATDRFFKDNKLTPYGEVEILRKFSAQYKALEIYVSAPKALKRAQDVLRFLAEQNLAYLEMRCIVVIDSLGKFEYKFTK